MGKRGKKQPNKIGAIVFPDGTFFFQPMWPGQMEMICKGIPRALYALHWSYALAHRWARIAYFVQKLKASTSVIKNQENWPRIEAMAAAEGIAEPVFEQHGAKPCKAVLSP